MEGLIEAAVEAYLSLLCLTLAKPVPSGKSNVTSWHRCAPDAARVASSASTKNLSYGLGREK
jgi:hypothetical protein